MEQKVQAPNRHKLTSDHVIITFFERELRMFKMSSLKACVIIYRDYLDHCQVITLYNLHIPTVHSR